MSPSSVVSTTVTPPRSSVNAEITVLLGNRSEKLAKGGLLGTSNARST